MNKEKGGDGGEERMGREPRREEEEEEEGEGRGRPSEGNESKTGQTGQIPCPVTSREHDRSCKLSQSSVLDLVATNNNKK